MRLLALSLMLCLLAGCGQKGALYLPNQQPKKHHGGKAASPAPAPAAMPGPAEGSAAAPESSTGMAPAAPETSAAAPETSAGTAPAETTAAPAETSAPNTPGSTAPAQP